MTDIEEHDPSYPISQMVIDSNIDDQIARMALVSVRHLCDLINKTLLLNSLGLVE